MIGFRNPLCWASAIMAVALAGMFEVIDQASMTTLVIVLPIAGWMATSGRSRCTIGRSV